MQKIIINYTSSEKRYALLKDGKVEKIIMDQPEYQSHVGSIYLGVVTKVLPGMNAVFVDIGIEKNAYLQRNKLASFVVSNDPDKEKKSISSFVHQGEKLLVQIEKDAAGRKGPKVTGILEFQSESMVYMPSGKYIAVSKKVENDMKRSELRRWGSALKTEEEGIIFRTAAFGLEFGELQEQLEKLRSEYLELKKKAALSKKAERLAKKDSFIEMVQADIAKMGIGEIITDDVNLKKQLELMFLKSNPSMDFSFYNGKENIFSVHRIDHEIDKALKRIVWMDNGSYLIFDETEALTVIDVNTGKYSGKNNLQETVVKTNMVAANEIARQLRLRDIGGIVLIDFIDMETEAERESILKTIRTALAKDEKQTKLLGFTQLGILQLTRKKTRVSLGEAMTERCPTCEGIGRIISAETIAFRLERELWEHRYSEFDAVLIETTEKVRTLFSGPGNQHKEMLEQSLGLKLFFSIVSTVPHFYMLKKFGTVHEIRSNIEECD